MSATERIDIISVWLAFMPHRIAGYTDPLKTSRTLSLGIVIVFIDLHKHRTLWVRTVSSGERVEQFSVMLSRKTSASLNVGLVGTWTYPDRHGLRVK